MIQPLFVFLLLSICFCKSSNGQKKNDSSSRTTNLTSTVAINSIDTIPVRIIIWPKKHSKTRALATVYGFKIGSPYVFSGTFYNRFWKKISLNDIYFEEKYDWLNK